MIWPVARRPVGKVLGLMEKFGCLLFFFFLENTYILMWSKLVHPMYNDMDIWQKIVLL